MPAPKGTRAVQFATPGGPGSAAVHIYSDPKHIWLQLRRDVPTEQAIGTPSFKVALNLTPQQAIAIAGELFAAATRNASPPDAATAKQPQNKKKAAKTSPKSPADPDPEPE
jgi:hypothetical protein